MKFNIGDKVRVVRCRTHVNCKNNNTIRNIIGIVANRCYPYELEGVIELFREDELELVQEKQFTKADLKDGDKCTLKNGQVIFVDKTSDYGFSNINEQLKYFNDDVSIVKVERPVKYETVFERKEEILDEEEKKYLADVIRPFKDKIESICKLMGFGKEFISIHLKNGESINFPYFKKGTMYKEMQTGKRYTLEKLGL